MRYSAPLQLKGAQLSQKILTIINIKISTLPNYKQVHSLKKFVTINNVKSPNTIQKFAIGVAVIKKSGGQRNSNTNMASSSCSNPYVISFLYIGHLTAFSVPRPCSVG
jgi:hypothetical protein